MKTALWKSTLASILALWSLTVFAVMACRSGGSAIKDQPAEAIKCSGQAIKDAWPTAYTPVMTCLVSVTSAPLACLDAIPAAFKVAIDVVACITHLAGNEAAYRVEANPHDVISVRKTERAAAWVEHHGFAFAD